MEQERVPSLVTHVVLPSCAMHVPGHVSPGSAPRICSVSQDYTATISLQQRWTDPRLVFHGNKSFTLDARLVELLWVPDTYIVESKRSFLHDVTVGNRLVRLFSNGTVLYALRYRDLWLCCCWLRIDFQNYPGQEQVPAVTGHEFVLNKPAVNLLLIHFPLFWPLEMPVKDQDLPSQYMLCSGACSESS